ncbi:hypothetical protein TRFO_23895 [Tritrichomonas foetus]|uniref:Uncharacterized protein n=1 Tax=Tritrichomonas foetus TaxID=1144522 RepID=A0A1J4K8G0_9EUKA|nr:hypothetical protein TRFO_23895 [Tritrichomonas foetus]|eukprot:OHT07785.1 hypothetical protein TRFO_23895 [Tritrichomonas foetus]
MFLARNIRSLENLSQLEDGRAEAKIIEIYNSLLISYFIPGEPSFKPDILPLTLQTILPLACSDSVSLRFQAESFLTRLSTILSAFSPAYLITAYKDVKTDELQPTAQSLMLNYYAIALHFLEPSQRSAHIETCHTLLLNSEPKYLRHLTKSDWALLSNSFSVSMFVSIIKFLLSSNDKILIAVMEFLIKSPETMLPLILERSDLQFLKVLIPEIPNYLHIPISLLKNRLISSFKSDNATDVSGAIEVVFLLMKRKRLSSEKSNWIEIFNEIGNLWSETQTISLKSAIINLYSNAAEQKLVPVAILRRFFKFDLELSTPILVSIIYACQIYIKITEEIPKGLIKLLKNVLFERDPLLYVAAIELLATDFNIMFQKMPNTAKNLLSLCLNPLPHYFVEQIAITHLLGNIDWNIQSQNENDLSKVDENNNNKIFMNTGNRCPLDQFKELIPNIILNFIEKPHQSLIPEIKVLIEKLNIEIPITKLNWYESASFYLPLVNNCDPFFVIELLDSYLIRAASFSMAADYLIKCITPENKALSEILFNRALYVTFKAIDALKLELKMVSPIYKMVSRQWKKVASSLYELLPVINDSLLNTHFGQIVNSCLKIISATVKFIDIQTNHAIDIVRIAKIFATAFTTTSCSIVSGISERFTDSNFRQEITKYFTSTFQFDDAVQVSLTAIECLNDSELPIVKDYINVASDYNRIVLLMYRDMTTLHNTFLAFKNDPDMRDYVKNCIDQIPFDNWQIEETDCLFISNLRNIKINNFDALDEFHQKVVKRFPETFEILNQKEYDNTFLVEDIPDSLNLGVIPETVEGEKGKFEDDELDYENDEKREKIEAVPFSPYNNIQPCKSLFYGFLWNSSRKLSDDDFIKAENYALSLNDSKITVAFLSYALKFNYQIQINAWTKNIKISYNDQPSTVAFCILASFIKATKKKWDELPDDQISLIHRILEKYGFHDAQPYTLVKIFKEEHGLIRMVAEAIISIDLERFAEFPLFADIFKDKENFENKLDDILEMMKDENNIYLSYEFVSLFSRFLAPKANFSQYEQFLFPKGIELINHYYPSKIGIEQFQSTLEKPEIREKVINFFENNRNFDSFLFHVIFHFEMKTEEFKRAIVPLGSFSASHPLYTHKLLFEQADNDPTTSISIFIFDSNTPPSYTREIVSLFVSPCCPSLPLYELRNVAAKLRPVFSALLFSDYDMFSPSLCDTSFPMPDEEYLLLSNPQNINIEKVNNLKSYFTKATTASNIIANQFYKLDPNILCKVFNTNSADAALIELNQKLIDTVINKLNYMSISIEIMKTILANTQFMQMCMIAVSDNFLNAEQKINVFFMLKLLDEKMEESEEVYKNMWKDMKATIPEKMKDKNISEMYQKDNSVDLLIKTLFTRNLNSD